MTNLYGVGETYYLDPEDDALSFEELLKTVLGSSGQMDVTFRCPGAATLAKRVYRRSGDVWTGFGSTPYLALKQLLSNMRCGIKDEVYKA